MKIYLSPSNQASNLYSSIKTNEKAEMEKLAVELSEALKVYDCEVIIADKKLSINPGGRSAEASKAGCMLYLALHSNAGGGGRASGAVAFYHPGSRLSREVAEALVKELDLLCPVPSNRAQPVANGMEQFGGYGLAEIRNPYAAKLVPVLLEVNFHDNPDMAAWIVSNTRSIAEGCSKALVRALGIRTKESSHGNIRLYKVQSGAFSNLKNAEELAGRLKKSGFDAWITG
jgi:N-acetylmuramoyl-L-alanine amidase